GLAVLGVRSAVVPLLLVDSLGVAPGWVGAAFVSSAVVQTALMFPAGKWADTAGRRAALITGAVIAAAGLALLAVGGSLVLALIAMRSEEHTSELQSRFDLVCRLLLEKQKKKK